ncbi:isatin hydrolase-like [Pecten maximus]|uniref:isatin hydrolase-like n=1 Tax=Pecten maximus TaxID=6579 RepID=UPI001458B7B9|nr:isatin hydrolase-like [Pecten maximus]
MDAGGVARLMLFLSPVFTIIPVEGRRIVDLSYDLDNNALTYPNNPRFNLTLVHEGSYGIVPWLQFGNVEFGVHTGTHIDSPNHFVKGGLQAHQISMERLMGPGVVINVKAKVVQNIDYEITDKDLMAWEEENGPIPKGAIVLMNSGWGARYPDFERVFNSSTYKQDHSSLHFPGFHTNAAQWLINKRNIYAIGVDTPSADNGRSSSFPVHQLITKENILIIENVANMDKLPSSGAYIYLPMLKFKGASGAPARMFAAIEDEGDRTNSATSFVFHVSAVGCLLVLKRLLI